MNEIPEVTPEERAVLEHALGLDNSKRSYRNRFAAAEGHQQWRTLTTLVERGLMVSQAPPPGGLFTLTLFFATDAGRAAVGAQLGTAGGAA